MCRVSRHMGSHLIIKILMFVYPRFYEFVDRLKSRGNTIKVTSRFRRQTFMRYIYFFPPFNFSESDHSF